MECAAIFDGGSLLDQRPHEDAETIQSIPKISSRHFVEDMSQVVDHGQDQVPDHNHVQDFAGRYIEFQLHIRKEMIVLCATAINNVKVN